jgi:hypothetical protein
MKGFSAVLISGVLLTVAPMALADSTNSLNVGGTVAYTPTTLNVSSLTTSGNTGSAASFDGGKVTYLLNTTDYLDTVTGSLALFTVTDGSGNTLTFYTTHNGVSTSLDPSTGNLDVKLDETGYYVVNGGSQMAGYFDVNLNGNSPDGSSGYAFTGSGGLGNMPTGTFDPPAGSSHPGFTLNLGSITDPPSAADLSAAPEPASFVLLGSGLLGLAALLSNRRRRHVSVHA